MFKNYLKITLRNLYRQKLYALINIFGLSMGIGCCLVLGLYVYGELSYDNHQQYRDRLYRVANEYTFSGNATQAAMSSPALGELMMMDNPDQIESYTRFQRPGGGGAPTVFRNGLDTYYWTDIYLVDLNVFDVFSHDIIYGNPEGALDDGLSIAVSESFARTYFGDRNPIGETLSTDTAEYRITLVFADLPETSHLKYDVLISMNRVGQLPESEAQLQQMMGNIGVFTYLLMAPGFDEASFGRMFAEFRSERMEAMARQFGLEDSFSARFWARNVTDVYLEPPLEFDVPSGNIFYIYSFTAVAIFILSIACINYVNLATARSMQRAREVGMRKVLGAHRNQLIWQFIGESLFFVLLALVVALGVVQLLINYNLLEDLLGSGVYSGTIFTPQLLALLFGLSLVVGVLSGLYPAFYLSSVAPSVALSGDSQVKGSTSGRLRQALVFFQFTISIGIIASTLLMANQMRFVSSLGLGFDKENKLLVTLRGADLLESLDALRSELASNPNILGVSVSQNMPGGQMGLMGVNVESSDGLMQLQSVSGMNVGQNFLPTMGIELIEGRDFTQRLLTDTGMSAIVNRTLVDRMGWDQPIGKRIESAGGPGLQGRVIGVVEDFHYASLYQPVGPLMMMAQPIDFSNSNAENRALASRTLVLNIAGQNISETLGFVQNVMTDFDPAHPFEYEFLDDQLDQLYTSEQHVMQLIAIFAGICIFISCLGLFGLASFTTARRTKEIGIRKVLGASSVQIITLLARSIMVLILIGAVVASIISFIVVNQWLNSFAYRDAINPGVFLLAAAVAVAVAFVTVALQSYRTVRSNPVIALRYE
ncbi:MAG: FtsX-like permease family protein [Pseudohongiellaceae bacterium]